MEDPWEDWKKVHRKGGRDPQEVGGRSIRRLGKGPCRGWRKIHRKVGKKAHRKAGKRSEKCGCGHGPEPLESAMGIVGGNSKDLRATTEPRSRSTEASPRSRESFPWERSLTPSLPSPLELLEKLGLGCGAPRKILHPLMTPWRNPGDRQERDSQKASLSLNPGSFGWNPPPSPALLCFPGNPSSFRVIPSAPLLLLFQRLLFPAAPTERSQE